MGDALDEMLAVGAVWQRVVWHGVGVALPREWNLTLHRGDARRGGVVFADMARNRLDVRWKKVARAEMELERLRARLRKEILRDVGEGAFGFVRPGEGAVMVATEGMRIFEVTFLEKGEWDAEVEAVVGDFLRVTRGLAEREEWPWRVYGIAGELPAWVKPRSILLLPGMGRMTARVGRGWVTLGSESLAEHRLAGRSLRAWATGSVKVLGKNATRAEWWEEGDAARARLMAPAALPFKAVTEYFFEFAHDRKMNVIRWKERWGPAGFADSRGAGAGD